MRKNRVSSKAFDFLGLNLVQNSKEQSKQNVAQVRLNTSWTPHFRLDNATWVGLELHWSSGNAFDRFWSGS